LRTSSARTARRSVRRLLSRGTRATARSFNKLARGVETRQRGTPWWRSQGCQSKVRARCSKCLQGWWTRGRGGISANLFAVRRTWQAAAFWFSVVLREPERSNSKRKEHGRAEVGVRLHAAPGERRTRTHATHCWVGASSKRYPQGETVEA
jgi:hypothetical protein